MIDLLLSIVLATYLVLCFRFFDRFRISNLHAIVLNYWTCVLTGILAAPGLSPPVYWLQQEWFPLAVALGLLFFVVFNLMGFLARHISATLTSLASKLSLVIPVLAAIILLREPMTWQKAVSLIMALASVVLFSLGGKASSGASPMQALLLALVIFLGSGLNDTLVNLSVQRYLTADAYHDFTVAVFSSASLWGGLVLLGESLWKRRLPSARALAAGILLGIPNYFSLFFLTRALSWQALSSSTIIIINNTGIVALTATAAAVLFGERFDRNKLTGLVVSLLAMGLLYWSER
ncbi:MAG: EamA family transporter [Chitinophagales bacterium]|nr:DMT family transporter [Chitinophagales bacterium]MDW8393413.1 EamA family transporter [Chitinophagales bacterium]